MVRTIPARSLVTLAASTALAAGACSTPRSAPGTGGAAGASSAVSTSGAGATSTTGPGGTGGAGAATAASSGAGAGHADAGAPNAAKECSPETKAVEQYHLPPIPAPPTNVSFTTDWSKNANTGGWYGEQIMDACRMHPDGFSTWHGRTSVRVEVDPGDDPLFLGENSERAEMLFTQSASGQQVNEEVTGGDQFYAMSYYFPTTWAASFYPWSEIEAHDSIDCSTGSQTQCNSWSHVMQLHTGSAFWGALSAAAKVTGGPQTYWLTLGSTYPFSDGGSIALGSWTDFVLEINWTSGAIALWRRDEGKTGFTQVVSATESTVKAVSGVYLKQGLYRGGYVKGRSDVFWIGPTAKGTSFSAVEQSAFGTNVGP